ncbi:MAG: GxxExxY protein, partial [Cyclobacteriaceae bacterium]
MHENEISSIIVNTSLKIHRELGPGLFESVYEEILTYELQKRDLFVERQKVIPVKWDQVIMDQGFRADLIIDRKVIIEIKSIEAVAP